MNKICLKNKFLVFILLFTLVTTNLFSATISICKNSITIRSLVIDTANTLWVATFGRGLWKISNNNITPVFDKKKQLPFSMINKLYICNKHLWIATAGKGSVALNLTTNKFDIIPQVNGFDRLHAIIKTSNNNMLIGSVGSGCAILENNSWKAINNTPPMSRKWINCFAEWQNKLWMGSSLGLYYIDVNKVEKNWKPNSCRLRQGVNCLLKVKNELLIGTTSNGLYYLKPNKKPKYISNTYGTIYQIIHWKNSLWAAGELGLWQFSNKNGTLTNEYVFSTPKALVVDHKNNLIIGTSDGKLISTSDSKKFTVIMKLTTSGLVKE